MSQKWARPVLCLRHGGKHPWTPKKQIGNSEPGVFDTAASAAHVSGVRFSRVGHRLDFGMAAIGLRSPKFNHFSNLHISVSYSLLAFPAFYRFGCSCDGILALRLHCKQFVHPSRCSASIVGKDSKAFFCVSTLYPSLPSLPSILGPLLWKLQLQTRGITSTRWSSPVVCTCCWGVGREGMED